MKYQDAIQQIEEVEGGTLKARRKSWTDRQYIIHVPKRDMTPNRRSLLAATLSGAVKNWEDLPDTEADRKATDWVVAPRE